jgi:hypothetical protein
VVARAEVHYGIEGFVACGDGPDIGLNQIDRRVQQSSAFRCDPEGSGIRVQADEVFRGAELMQARQRYASAATNLQDAGSSTEAEALHEQRDLQILLPRVAIRFLRKSPVLAVC